MCHQKPGAHAPEHDEDDRPGSEPKRPEGHSLADEFVEPTGQ
jgi:hypothetical protein